LVPVLRGSSVTLCEAVLAFRGFWFSILVLFKRFKLGNRMVTECQKAVDEAAAEKPSANGQIDPSEGGGKSSVNEACKCNPCKCDPCECGASKSEISGEDPQSKSQGPEEVPDKESEVTGGKTEASTGDGGEVVSPTRSGHCNCVVCLCHPCHCGESACESPDTDDAPTDSRDEVDEKRDTEVGGEVGESRVEETADAEITSTNCKCGDCLCHPCNCNSSEANVITEPELATLSEDGGVVCGTEN